MSDFMEVKKDIKIAIIGEPPPLFRHFNPSGHGVVMCPGAECPVCEVVGKSKATEKRAYTIVDKENKQLKHIMLSQEQYDKMFGNIQPKGRCLHVRLGKFEVLFWTMWWKLSWRDKRQVTASEFQSWMYGPWEFRRYG